MPVNGSLGSPLPNWDKSEIYVELKESSEVSNTLFSACCNDYGNVFL